MGDYFETIADVEATPDEAGALAAGVLAWLAATRVILPEPRDTAFGRDGYVAGPGYGDVTDEAEAGGDMGALEVCTTRTVFSGYQFEPGEAGCPRCGAVLRLYDETFDRVEAAWRPFLAAIDAWSDTGESVPVACPSCEAEVHFNDWRWDEPMALGHLGFTFWNSAPLTEQFVAELSRRLGHRTVRIEGKL